MTNVSFAFARHALVAALQHLGARSGDLVAVPEFICRDVLASLHHVGVQPHFYPVGRDLRPRDLSIENSIRFVLMVNYFGFPQDVAEFRAKWPRAQIIEDNAHGYLSRDAEGIELGTRTEAGITSCRKTISLPDGALLHTLRAPNENSAYLLASRRPPIGFTIRRTSSRLERSTGIPFNFALRTLLRAIRKARTGSALPQSDESSETELPADVYMSRQASRILSSIDTVHEVQRRRDLFRRCAEFASKEGVEAVFSELPIGCSPYGFPFVSQGPIEAVVQFARRQHCEVITWPDLPSAVAVPADHFYRQVRVINFL